MVRTVEDTALSLDVLTGHDDRDPFSVPRSETEYVEATGLPTTELR